MIGYAGLPIGCPTALFLAVRYRCTRLAERADWLQLQHAVDVVAAEEVLVRVVDLFQCVLLGD